MLKWHNIIPPSVIFEYAVVGIVKSKSPTLVRCASGKHGGNCHRKGMYIFLKLQNFLRINFCKVPCFERRLHIVSEKFGSFCCYSDCFAAKILFYLKKLLINSLFSFILRTFAEHSQ